MTDTITLTLPDDVSARVRHIAEQTARPVEQILIDHIKTLNVPMPALPHEVQSELDALQALSDDALWTIAREHMSELAEARAHMLMDQKTLTDVEQQELDHLVERADQLTLRKAEAAAILRAHGNYL